MRGINKAILVGIVMALPKIKYKEDGKVSSTEFQVYTEFHDKHTGAIQKEVHHIISYDKVANVARYEAYPGKTLYLEGLMKKYTWVDDEGRNNLTKIIAHLIYPFPIEG